MSNEQLASITKQIEKCQRCNLYKAATHAVPGSGNSDAKVVFIGEAPGFNEDAQGLPFVGNAGRYLDTLLAKVGLSRRDIFITNMVKHRPPENRDPTYPEIAACGLWLDEQLAVLDPKVIVTLGRFSLARFLPNAKISTVHGQAFRAGKFVVVPMYHPAAALRSLVTARELEDDFLKNRLLLNDPYLANDIEQPYGEGGQGSLF